MQSIINWLDLYLNQKAPKLPQGLKNFIVKATPWLVVLSLILAVPAILALFGFGYMFGGYGMMYGYGSYGFMGIIVVAIAVLQLMALPSLFHQKMKGWTLLFYLTALSFAASILSFDAQGIIGGVLGLYILFQIRSLYTA